MGEVCIKLLVITFFEILPILVIDIGMQKKNIFTIIKMDNKAFILEIFFSPRIC